MIDERYEVFGYPDLYVMTAPRSGLTPASPSVTHALAECRDEQSVTTMTAEIASTCSSIATTSGT